MTNTDNTTPSRKPETMFESDERCLLYVTDPSWVFGLEDEKQHQFGLLVEIQDLYSITGDECFEEYPIDVEVSIVAHKPHTSTIKAAGVDESDVRSEFDRIEAAYSYCGGVPITHTLQDSIKSGAAPSGLAGALEGIDPSLYTVEDRAVKFGTVAAQRGPGSVFSHPRFRGDDYEAAKQYAANLLDRAGAMGGHDRVHPRPPDQPRWPRRVVHHA